LESEYDASLEAYNRRVDFWNARGGAPTEIVDILERERNRLNTDLDRLKQAVDEAEFLRLLANKDVDGYNELLTQLRRVLSYYEGQFGSTEIDKVGECVLVGNRPKSITIYAFVGANQLIRVLAHELGHALGLKHVKGQGAIMSAYDTGEEPEGAAWLTPRDRSEFRRVRSK